VSQLTREAWKAYFKGNYLRAGDLYKAAGEREKAAKMYLKGGDLAAAAEVEEALGRIQSAVDLLLRTGDITSAAEVLSRHGHYARAAHLMGESGNKAQAAFIALKGGNGVLAAQYFEQSGRFMEAGRLLMQEGNVGKALLLFERALKNMPLSEAQTPSEHLQSREQMAEIAGYLEQGQAYARAAEVYEALHRDLQAGQCWEAAKSYTKAMECYHRAGAPDRVAALAEKSKDTPVELQAEALVARGETEEAARLFARAGKRDRAASLFESSGNLPSAAELRREMGDFEMAGNLFYRVQAYLPAAECFQQAQLFSLAKQCYLAAGDQRAASRMAFESGEWEDAVDLAPSDEDRETILHRLQALPESAGDVVRVRLLKGRLFAMMGQPELALTCLEGMPETQGDRELWRLYITGKALEELGDYEKAGDAYRRLLSLNVAFQDVRERMEEVSRQPAAAQGRYVRVTSLGEGRYGLWFEGRDEALRLPVRLLVSPAERPPSRLVEDRDELQRLLGLAHPAILALRDVDRSRKEVLMVYEDFGGRPLAEWLREGYQPSVMAALDKLRQVIEALSEAHSRRVLHGHLSPDSVLMDSEGRVKVQGFGIVRSYEDLELRSPSDPLALYLPPETTLHGNLSISSDLYGAGALFMHLVAGHPPATPLAGDLSLRSWDESLFKGVSLSAASRDVVRRLLAPDLMDRYGTAEDALRDLSALELPPGSVISGRYEIMDELGRGGMGQVFRVKDRDLDEVVALKTLRRRPDMDEASRARFLREIKLTRKITHPNVVRVFDLGTWRDLTYLTMEYIPGKTLSQWMREGEGRRANLRQKVEILRGISEGLTEAHRLGIVHRDLKPQNVILTPAGIPKLLDFGIAYVAVDESSELTGEGRFVGSPKYVSPEQIQGQPLDARSDIYCFGLLAYFLVTGQDPFSGENPALIVLKQLKEQPLPPSRLVRLPARLEQLILCCLSKSPKDRPANLGEVSSVLKEIV
jgi:serine/threonine protein kinase